MSGNAVECVRKTSLKRSDSAAFSLHRLGHSRCQIDADVFQTLTTCSSLKQPSLHQGYERALLMLTMIPVLAFTLTQAFYRRHFRKPGFGFRDLAQRIAYQSLAPSSTFNSS